MRIADTINYRKPLNTIFKLQKAIKPMVDTKRTFMVNITKEDNFFVARCPELGVTSQGKTLEEAQANIKEAIELYIESFGTEDLPAKTSEPFWTTVEVAYA